jgi:hypothetical protein
VRIPKGALAELRALYSELDGALGPFARRCVARGNCCHFRTTGHMLYVTDLEAAEMALSAAAPQNAQSTAGTCPYLAGTQCGARERRALGCRIYYCDGTYETERNAVCETFLARIRAIEKAHGIGHQYRPVTGVDFEREFS